MSSKRRKEKSYSIHGMQSILSAFISRHQFAIKPYDSYGTNRASTGCLFRYLEQFGYVKKKKKNTHTQWKIRIYKSTSLFQITVGYNQWCPRLHHKKRTSDSLNAYSISNSLNTHSTSNSLKKKRRKRWDGRESGLFQKKKKRGMEEKVVDFKKKKRGKGDKGERHNEKKTRRRRRGKKRWGQRREKEEEADEKAVEPERKKERKEKKRCIREGEEDGRKARSAAQSMHHPPPPPPPPS